VKSTKNLGVGITIIDGAISRLSSASPAISKAMVLSTGAAFSSNMNTLVQKTKFVVELINLPLAEDTVIEAFDLVENGVWGISSSGDVIDFGITSSLAIASLERDITQDMKYIFVAGALTDRFLNLVGNSGNIKNVTLVVRDFTKIFVNEMLYRNFVSRGGRIVVLQKSKLVAVCVNPTAPNGYVLDSEVLCEKLQEAIKLPVYDIVKNRYDI
jgi:hypothetical protein